MEKTVRITNFKDAENEDFEYWLQKTPEEKLDTLQYLREMVYDLKNEDRKGLQRILRVIKRKRG